MTNLSILKYSINRLTNIKEKVLAIWCQKHTSHSIEWINLFLVSAFDLYPFSLCHMINLMYFLLNWMKMYNLSIPYSTYPFFIIPLAHQCYLIQPGSIHIYFVSLFILQYQDEKKNNWCKSFKGSILNDFIHINHL